MRDNIIAITGRKRHGKDTLGSYLAEHYGAKTISPSDAVRSVSHRLFPWLPEVLPDAQKDVPCMHLDNPRGLTPREVWRTVDILRERVDPQLFLREFRQNQLDSAMQDLSTPYVITRVSTAEEFEYLREAGIKIIRVVRADTTGVDVDPFEDYLATAEVDHEFVFDINDGPQPFLDFFREVVLWKSNPIWVNRSLLNKSLGI